MKKFKEKICEVCGKEFIPTSNNQKICSNECKKIKNKEYKKEYYKQNKECCNEKSKQHYKQNKERYKENNKQWREQNKEYKKDYDKQWYEQNKEYNKEYKKQYYKQNKERYKEHYKQWRERNKERYKEYHRTKYNTDLQHKLTQWSRRQIGRCLNSDKTEHTFDILDYTPEQLKQRLEMNFKPDMNWSNHGTLWHIDHRKPLCKFNLTLPDGTPNYEQIRLANSLANLQPLYVTENLSKGGK